MPSPKNTATRSRRAAAPKPSPRKSNAKGATAASLHETWKKEQESGAAQNAARTAQLAASLDLEDLDIEERVFLAICQQIDRRHSGCTSPFEEFFTGLARSVEYGNWPTPDDVEHELGEFRDNFNSARRWSALFYEAYPRSTKSAPDSPESDAAPQSPLPLGPQESAARDLEIDRREIDWESKTPPELIYQLECFSPNDLEQRVHLTRAEYIALKEQLARIRGFAAQEAARAEGAQSRG